MDSGAMSRHHIPCRYCGKIQPAPRCYSGVGDVPPDTEISNNAGVVIVIKGD
jgi:hypothetical protein